MNNRRRKSPSLKPKKARRENGASAFSNVTSEDRPEPSPAVRERRDGGPAYSSALAGAVPFEGVHHPARHFEEETRSLRGPRQSASSQGSATDPSVTGASHPRRAEISPKEHRTSLHL